MIMMTYPEHGCVYAVIDGGLATTPLYEDLTFDTCTDNWVEVDPDCSEVYDQVYQLMNKMSSVSECVKVG